MHLVDLVESVPVGRPLSYKSWRLVFELFLCVAFVIVMMIKRYIYKIYCRASHTGDAIRAVVALLSDVVGGVLQNRVAKTAWHWIF